MSTGRSVRRASSLVLAPGEQAVLHDAGEDSLHVVPIGVLYVRALPRIGKSDGREATRRATYVRHRDDDATKKLQVTAVHVLLLGCSVFVSPPTAKMSGGDRGSIPGLTLSLTLPLTLTLTLTLKRPRHTQQDRSPI